MHLEIESALGKDIDSWKAGERKAGNYGVTMFIFIMSVFRNVLFEI